MRIEAELALGHQRDVVGELETLIAQHPLRERLRSQHMLALYRSGRHAEALASYQTFRRTLAEELGIEPSASLRELERQMLQQDTSLELPTSTEVPATAPAEAGAVSTAPVGEVSYARSGDIRIAYQVVGDGPLDLVLVHGWVCTFQPGWEYPKLAAFYRRLASMGRLILFDKRGTGLSDRVSPERLPDLETRMDDVRAVLDSVGSERAVLLGLSEGGAMSTLFAATHPAASAALVLMGTFPREMQAPDYPSGVSEEDLRRRLALLEEDDWASPATRDWLGRVAPDILRDPAALRWYASYVRRGASPSASKALRLMNAEIDIRDLLPTISVPTLVLHRAQETWRDGSRFMGEHIPGARVVELPGNDHLPWEGDQDALLDEIERFLTGVREDVRAGPRARHASVHRHRRLHGEGGGARRPRLERPAHQAPSPRARAARSLSRPRGRHGRRRRLRDVRRPGARGPVRLGDRGSAQALGLEVRAGVHTGEVEQADGGVRGIAVHIAARIAAAAAPGEVLVSSTVKDIVAGSGIAFEERGEHELDGVPGTWRLFTARI